MTRSLGRLPVKDDTRTLEAQNYLHAVSPPPPSVDWISKVPTWGMFDNDLVLSWIRKIRASDSCLPAVPRVARVC